MITGSDFRSRRGSARPNAFLRAALVVIAVATQLLPPALVRATDFPGALPVALDQPRINAALRRTPTGTPLTADFGGGVQTFNITAFYDTGASGVLVSEQTADLLGVSRLRWPNPTTGPFVEFEDVGVAGSDIFNVSEPLYVSLASYPGGEGIDDPAQHLTVYNQTFGQLRTQIGPLNADPNPLLEGLDIFGMPTMTGKVIVMDPKPTDPNGNPFPDVMRTYVYNPGTPFNAGTVDSNPGIPTVDRSIALSYASFSRFTQISPADAPGPSLRSNPFLGPNPVLQLDPNPPVDTTPGVSITFGNQTTTGSWLLDTGAAASIISLTQAANLHVRYVAGTYNTDNPQLETYDPANPNQPGTVIADQFTLDIGGIGGTTRRSGFYLDSLLVRATEGNPLDDNDPNHLRYVGAGVIVSDITLQDPMTEQTLTLDGVFGMNMLVASASLTPGPIPFPDVLQDGYFNWVVFDEPNARLGLDLKDFVAPFPNEWIRASSGNWGSAFNWSEGQVPDGNDKTAFLGTALTSSGNVSLESTDRTVRVLRFSNGAGSYNVTSTGGTLIFDSSNGPAAIQFDVANTKSHEISAPIRIKSDLDIDAALDTLTLSGGQTWDPGRTVTVRTGTVKYNLDASDNVTIGGNNALIIDDGAMVQLAGSKTPLSAAGASVDIINNSATGLTILAGDHRAGFVAGEGVTALSGGASLTADVVHQSALTIGTGSRVEILNNGTNAGVSVLGALSIAGTPAAPTAKIDLTNNAAVIDYTGTSPVGTVRQQIVSGRGGAGLGKPWNGQGITSSQVQSDVVTSPNSTSLGYAENSGLPLGAYTMFHGQQVDSTSVLIAYTRTADANLDGVVNDDDVTIVGANYAPGIAKASWALGDFDYNGFVDDDDVTLLGVFYNPNAPPLAVPSSGAGAGVAVVPEPGTLVLSLVAAFGIGVMIRRRRVATRRHSLWR